MLRTEKRSEPRLRQPSAASRKKVPRTAKIRSPDSGQGTPEPLLEVSARFFQSCRNASRAERRNSASSKVQRIPNAENPKRTKRNSHPKGAKPRFRKIPELQKLERPKPLQGVPAPPLAARSRLRLKPGMVRPETGRRANSRQVLPEIRSPRLARPEGAKPRFLGGQQTAKSGAPISAKEPQNRNSQAHPAGTSGATLRRAGSLASGIETLSPEKIALGTLAALRFGLGRARSLPQKFFPETPTQGRAAAAARTGKASPPEAEKFLRVPKKRGRG